MKISGAVKGDNFAKLTSIVIFISDFYTLIRMMKYNRIPKTNEKCRYGL